jgi:hypothetical protein
MYKPFDITPVLAHATKPLISSRGLPQDPESGKDR